MQSSCLTQSSKTLFMYLIHNKIQVTIFKFCSRKEPLKALQCATTLNARFYVLKTTISFSIYSVACNDTHYGTSCNQLCPCITTNTADCDDTFGTCTCLPNWTGENCTVDVDECITNSNSCNFATQECVNYVGGFSCVCLYGNSSTGCIGTVY